MKKHLLGCLTLLAVTGCGEGLEDSKPRVTDAPARSLASVASGFQVVQGDSPCPQDQYLMPVDEAVAYRKELCYALVPDDIVRLEGSVARHWSATWGLHIFRVCVGRLRGWRR
ncbi:hypothetical protein ACLESO_06290 [Pyxidicoccus sp. 3LG]